MRVFLVLFFLAFSGSVFAEDAVSLNPVAPVLHEGRVKPLDSFARIMLRNIYGEDAFDGGTAVEWLAGVVTDPAAAALQDVFYVLQRDVKGFYGLDLSEKYFSAQDIGASLVDRENEIDALLNTPESDLTSGQLDALVLYEDLLALTGLMKGEVIVYVDIEAAHAGRLQMEVWYNALQPYQWAMGFYGVALLLGVLAVVKREGIAVNLAAFVALFFGGLLHGGAIAARVYILERPPVGTLYESVLFVGFVCALWALVSCVRQPRIFHLLAGAFAALAILVVAPYSTAQAETKEMLVAVLNTNFWLATHVLIITAGYGLCILTAILAHLGFVVRGEGLDGTVYRTSIAALLFMSVGTILGGIWADQSWGRFWGWDPKENGALLICLWLIWLQHGRHSGHLSGARFLAGCAFLNVVVAVSWFGVNLLGVGLHSYGFVNGMAVGLGAFCGAQIALIVGLLMWRVRRGLAA